MLVLAKWGGAFLILSVMRLRLGAYFCVPAALLAAEGIAWLRDRIAARLGWSSGGRRLALGLALAAVVAGPTIAVLGRTLPGVSEDQIALARWW